MKNLSVKPIISIISILIWSFLFYNDLTNEVMNLLFIFFTMITCCNLILLAVVDVQSILLKHNWRTAVISTSNTTRLLLRIQAPLASALVALISIVSFKIANSSFNSIDTFYVLSVLKYLIISSSAISVSLIIMMINRLIEIHKVKIERVILELRKDAGIKD